MEATLTNLSWRQGRRRNWYEENKLESPPLSCQLHKDSSKIYANIRAMRRWKAYQQAFFRALEVQMSEGSGHAITCRPTMLSRVKEAEQTLEQRFQEQADKWDRETAHMSSPLQRMIHPSYQAILGMSAESPENKREIIRFMLHDLKDNHREWSLALSYLTQHNPINPKDYGKTSKIAAAWVRWGEDQGLI